MLFGSHRLFDSGSISASSGGVASFGFIAQRSTTSITTNLTLPTGSQAGDLVVYLMLSNNSIEGPTGWTSIDYMSYSTSPNQRYIEAFYKILTSSDVSAGSISQAGVNNTIERRALTFRPSTPITTANVIGYSQLTSRTSTVSGLEMNSGLSNPCLVFAHYSLGPYATPTNDITFSNADGTTGTYRGLIAVAYELTAPTGSITARSTNGVTISTTDYWATAIFAITAT